MYGNDVSLFLNKPGLQTGFGRKPADMKAGFLEFQSYCSARVLTSINNRL
jgi:hypothetical protein